MYEKNKTKQKPKNKKQNKIGVIGVRSKSPPP